MTEEINHSYDGGLYPELIRNRAFMDDSYGPHGWVLVEQGDAQASMELDKSTGPSAAIPRSLKISIQTADARIRPASRTPAIGAWRYAATRRISVPSTPKRDGGLTGPIIARLVSDRTGAVLAQASVPAITGEWQQYKLALKTGTVPVVSAENHFEIGRQPSRKSLSQPGLRLPADLSRSRYGLRPDLMEKLAAMQPKFLRLPGGNYLEGDHIAERFEWKKTIGPLGRSPHAHQPVELSLLRWHGSARIPGVVRGPEDAARARRLCRLLPDAGACGAGPGPRALRSGCARRNRVRDRRRQHQVGRRTRKGRSSRALPLTYVEIGNEDWFDRSDSYDGRYAQFYKAIKARYPQLQLIATTPVKSVKPDVIDDHYYRSATEFFNDTHHYDKTDRNGPKIFVGEWATREGTPTPNMGAALGDAAWMTGMERNSDLIVMASYAPLLANVNPGAMQWDTDLIGYDAVNSYGSPSYYAQVMFAGHLGNEVLGAQMTNAGPRFFESATRDSATGTIHLKLVNGSSIPQAVRIHLKRRNGSRQGRAADNPSRQHAGGDKQHHGPAPHHAGQQRNP